jgi:hypothetical protein
MKYVLMFFTFLSVCTTAELLQIPLTLDTTRTVTIPAGVTDVEETITVKPSDDPDFQKYLDKIKGYTIESVSLSADNAVLASGLYGLPNMALASIIVNFPDYNFTTTKIEFLHDGKDINLGLNGDQLAKMAESIQKNGSMQMKVTAYTSSFFGKFDLKVKINLKIKV